MLDESSLDTKDQEERDRSIMGFNVLESSAENGNKRMKDVYFINDFVTEGLHIQSVEIEYVARIGKYEGNKKRHMKVKFCNRTDQVKVLKNLCNLSEVDEKSVNSSNKHYLVVSKKNLLPKDPTKLNVGKLTIFYTKSKLNILEVRISLMSADIIYITEILPMNRKSKYSIDTYQLKSYNIITYNFQKRGICIYAKPNLNISVLEFVYDFEECVWCKIMFF